MRRAQGVQESRIQTPEGKGSLQELHGLREVSALEVGLAEEGNHLESIGDILVERIENVDDAIEFIGVAEKSREKLARGTELGVLLDCFLEERSRFRRILELQELFRE